MDGADRSDRVGDRLGSGTPEDAALVPRIAAGDEIAFRDLFERYFHRLASFAHRQTGSAAAAEDIVHDVFLSVWRRRAEWAPTASVAQYLFAAVHHLSGRYGRRDARIIPYTDDADQGASGQLRANSSPETDVLHAELARAYERAVAAMPERMRAIYTLNREQRLTYAEIAAVLGISVKTVETQMGRALARLRKALAPFR